MLKTPLVIEPVPPRRRTIAGYVYLQYKYQSDNIVELATKVMMTNLGLTGRYAEETLMHFKDGRISAPVDADKWAAAEKKTANFMANVMAANDERTRYIAGYFIPEKDAAELLFRTGKQLHIMMTDGVDVVSRCDVTYAAVRDWAAAHKFCMSNADWLSVTVALAKHYDAEC
jgi:hypothetical protein